MWIRTLALPALLALSSIACADFLDESEESPGGKADHDDDDNPDNTVPAPSVLIGADGDGGSFDVVEEEDIEVNLPKSVALIKWGVVRLDGLGQPRIDLMPPAPDAPADAHGSTRFRWSTTAGLGVLGEHMVVLGHPKTSAGEPAETFTFWVTVREPGRAAEWSPAGGRTTVDVDAGEDVVAVLPVGPPDSMWFVDSTDDTLGFPQASAFVDLGSKKIYRLLWSTSASHIGNHRVSLVQQSGDGTVLKTLGLTIRIAQ